MKYPTQIPDLMNEETGTSTEGIVPESTGILHLHSNHKYADPSKAAVQVFCKRICTLHRVLILYKPFDVNTLHYTCSWLG